MNIDQKYLDLINADIDGELDDSERKTLEEFIASNPEAAQYRQELRSLCNDLDSMEALEPPPHLKYAIMDNLKKPAREVADETSGWQQILAFPIFRHAVAFAAGVFMTIALINSNQISDQAFDDVTGLVGTISDEGHISSSSQLIKLKETMIAGTVSTHHAGSLTVVDFNLSAAGQVEIIANFSDRDLWFRGFAQLENDGAEVRADSGNVTMTMRGRNRYAMYLHHASDTDVNLTLKFFAAGALVHEADLLLRAPGGMK